MFKGHPKGLIVAFFANMGERFGFYTMMAILVLFLQAKYELSVETAGNIFSWFYFGIYALALVGGIIADYTRKYKTVILIGIITMLIGYVLMAIPGMTLQISIAGLFIIALGNGLFKGNLQAVVGQLYDNPKYSALRDRAYLIFYMGINIGAFFAPFAAKGIRTWMLKANGFLDDSNLPTLCHQVINGTFKNLDAFKESASNVSLNGPITDITKFANDYLNVFIKGYNFAFGLAAVAMTISLLAYLLFNKHLPNKEKIAESTSNIDKNAQNSFISIALSLGLMATTAIIFQILMKDVALGMAIGLFIGFVSWIFQISTKEERPSIVNLILVFVVVIFFWMSFHQNGLTLTLFAKDYTYKQVDAITNIFFNLSSILIFIGCIGGLVVLLNKKLRINWRMIGGAAFIILGGIVYYIVKTSANLNSISPEIFQSFNPLFIVSLTFVVMGIFSILNKKGLEPSTPKKIGIGMIIASFGFLLVLICSLDLVSPMHLKEVINGKEVFQVLPDASRVTPYWLIGSYLILTIAELFLSPMGLSFVSKVAPSRFQGLMQGGWLLATAVGNKLLIVGSFFWSRVELWQLWSIFMVCCLLSAAFIFSVMKRLERTTKG